LRLERVRVTIGGNRSEEADVSDAIAAPRPSEIGRVPLRRKRGLIAAWTIVAATLAALGTAGVIWFDRRL
jgi:hypothetical protein